MLSRQGLLIEARAKQKGLPVQVALAMAGPAKDCLKVSLGPLKQKQACAAVLHQSMACQIGARPGQGPPWGLMPQDAEWKALWHSAQIPVQPT